MEFLKKVKISLRDYEEMPVIVKPLTPRSLKTLKKLKSYEVNPDLKEILNHPHLDVYDLDPNSLIVKTNKFYENEITISVNRQEIIENFDKFEITEFGKLNRIKISKEDIQKHIEKMKEKEEKELEIEVKSPTKTKSFPGIKR